MCDLGFFGAQLFFALARLQRQGASTVFSGFALELLVAGFLDVLHHVHGVVFKEWRIGNESDVEPSTVLDDEFRQGLKVQVGFLDLRVVHGVSSAVLNARKVAVEFLGADALTHDVKEFTIIFGGSHLTVATSVNVSNVEHRNRSFNVVDDLKDLFEAAPEFLSPRGLNTDF